MQRNTVELSVSDLIRRYCSSNKGIAWRKGARLSFRLSFYIPEEIISIIAVYKTNTMHDKKNGETSIPINLSDDISQNTSYACSYIKSKYSEFLSQEENQCQYQAHA